MKLLAVLFAALVAVGCKEQSTTKSAAPLPAAASLSSAPAPAVEMPLDPKAVLVDVNGTKLTVGEAQQQMAARFSSMNEGISDEQRRGMEQQMFGSLADQFVVRTLLLEDADRQKILISEEEKTVAYDKIRASLPKGTTLEEIMKKSPLGEEKMKEEILVGLRINKLLTEYLTNRVASTEEDLTKFMAENKDKLSMPEHVRARHILLAFNPDDTDATKAEKKAKAEKIRKELVGGAAFAQMAKDNSDCPSREKGGDLGTFARGQMVKPFEDAAFGLATGTVSEVVETQFGYHIIEAMEHKQAGEMAREEVAEVMKNQKQQEATRTLIEELRAKAKIQYGDMLKPETRQP